MSITSLINEKLKRSRTAPKAFVSVVQQQEIVILEKLLSDLSMLQTDAFGKLVVNTANINQVNAMVQSISNVFYDREYQSALTEFVQSISTQASTTNALLASSLGDIPTGETLFATVLRQSQINAVNILGAAAAEAVYIAPLQEQLMLSLTSGASLRETIRTIKTMTVGDEQSDALLSRYAQTYSRTTFAQADNNYATTIAKTMNAQFYKYAGDTIETTRKFCKDRHNMFFHVKEVESWGLLKEWGGRINGTNPATIFTNRGGWNCRHTLVAYSAKRVPEQDLKRAIRLGFWKPTAQEKKELNL
jgi:hypothetical protein